MGNLRKRATLNDLSCQIGMQCVIMVLVRCQTDGGTGQRIHKQARTCDGTCSAVQEGTASSGNSAGPTGHVHMDRMNLDHVPHPMYKINRDTPFSPGWWLSCLQRHPIHPGCRFDPGPGTHKTQPMNCYVRFEITPINFSESVTLKSIVCIATKELTNKCINKRNNKSLFL